MENQKIDTKKIVLLLAAFIGALYLFLKDKRLEKNRKSFEKKSLKRLRDGMLAQTAEFDSFKAILDKEKIYRRAVEEVSKCYDEKIFSEAALINKIKAILLNVEAEKKIEVLDFIVQLAFEDRIVTDKEKETLNQITHHLKIPEEKLDELLKKKPGNNNILRLLFITVVFGLSGYLFVYFNPMELNFPAWLSKVVRQSPEPAVLDRNSAILKNSPAQAYNSKGTITTCSYLLEERYDPAKEFESGRYFAECINAWEISSAIQEDTTGLSENERNVPQENFELFKSFLTDPEKPNNLFNWVLGVLSVKPNSEYLPYLAVFQRGCIAYLESITEENNPLVEYFRGRNPNVYKESSDICDNSAALLSCGGLQKIKETNYLILKNKFIKIDHTVFMEIFEGNMDKDETYEIIQKRSLSETGNQFNYKKWIYNNKKLSGQKLKRYIYEVTEKEKGIDKKFGVITYPHLPGHSIGFHIIMPKSSNLEDRKEGINYRELYTSRTGNSKEYDAMADFVFKRIMDEYPENRGNPYIESSSDNIHLLGLAQSTKDEKIYFKYLGKTRMEKGTVNVNIEESNLNFISHGGYLIYAYDSQNRAFGILKNLSQPIFERNHIRATSFFFPLD